jgi:hypothetical protein
VTPITLRTRTAGPPIRVGGKPVAIAVTPLAGPHHLLAQGRRQAMLPW